MVIKFWCHSNYTHLTGLKRSIAKYNNQTKLRLNYTLRFKSVSIIRKLVVLWESTNYFNYLDLINKKEKLGLPFLDIGTQKDHLLSIIQVYSIYKIDESISLLKSLRLI